MVPQVDISLRCVHKNLLLNNIRVVKVKNKEEQNERKLKFALLEADLMIHTAKNTQSRALIH